MGQIGTKSAYARHRGCTPGYIGELIRKGKLRFPALLADGRIDFDLADAMVGPPSPRPPSGHDTTIARYNPDGDVDAEDYATARARREAANATLAELELAEAEGRLMDTEAVNATMDGALTAIREGLLNLPARCAALIGAEIGVAEAVVFGALQRQVDAFLTEIASEFERRAG